MQKYNFELKKDKSKYLQIYNHIMDLILKKEIQANEKLPPIRKLAKYMCVNNTTVVKSYELLEKEGYVYKTVGSGTFASSLSKEKPNIVTEGEDIIRVYFL